MIKKILLFFIFFSINVFPAVEFNEKFSKYGAELELNNNFYLEKALKAYIFKINYSRIHTGNTLEYFDNIQNNLVFKCSTNFQKKYQFFMDYDLLHFSNKNHLSADEESFRKIDNNTSIHKGLLGVSSKLFKYQFSLASGVAAKKYNEQANIDGTYSDEEKIDWLNYLSVKGPIFSQKNHKNYFTLDFEKQKNEYLLKGDFLERFNLDNRILVDANYAFDHNRAYYIQIDEYKEIDKKIVNLSVNINRDFVKYYFKPKINSEETKTVGEITKFTDKNKIIVENGLIIGTEKHNVEINLKNETTSYKYEQEEKNVNLKENYLHFMINSEVYTHLKANLFYSIDMRSYYYFNNPEFKNDMDNLLQKILLTLEYQWSKNFKIGGKAGYYDDKMYFIKSFYSIDNRHKKTYLAGNFWKYNILDNLSFGQEINLDANYVFYVNREDRDQFYRKLSFINKLQYNKLTLSYELTQYDYGNYIKDIYYKTNDIKAHNISISDSLQIFSPNLTIYSKYSYQRGNEFYLNKEVTSYESNIFNLELIYAYSRKMELHGDVEIEFYNVRSRSIKGYCEIRFRH